MAKNISKKNLLSLLPNGLTFTAPLTRKQSEELNGRIKFDKKHEIKPVDEFMLLCIKSKCCKSLHKQQPFKASNYTKSHLKSKHKKEGRQELDKEVLVHSFFTTKGYGDEQQYDKQYLLVKITGPSTFQYIKRKQSRLSPQQIQNGSKYSCFDEINVSITKSSRMPKKARTQRIKAIEMKSDSDNDDNLPSNVQSSKPSNVQCTVPSNVQCNTSNVQLIASSNDVHAFRGNPYQLKDVDVYNDIQSIKQTLSTLTSTIKALSIKPQKSTLITDYYQSSTPTKTKKHEKKKKYVIPRKNTEFIAFSQKIAKHLFDIIYIMNIYKFSGFCILCKKWIVELIKKFTKSKLSVVVTGILMTKSQMQSQQFYKGKWQSLYHHFNQSEQHKFAEYLEEKLMKQQDDTLTLHCDIAYGQQLYSLPAYQYTEKIILFHNQRLRSNCKCVPVGDYYHDRNADLTKSSRNNVRIISKSYYEIIINYEHELKEEIICKCGESLWSMSVSSLNFDAGEGFECDICKQIRFGSCTVRYCTICEYGVCERCYISFKDREKYKEFECVTYCSFECDSGYIQCTACRRIQCIGHFNEYYNEILSILNVEKLTMDTVRNMEHFMCWQCLEKVSDTIEEHQAYIDELHELQYGEDGRWPISKLRKGDDAKWLILCIDKLLFEYKELKYDDKKFDDLRFDTEFMANGRDQFIQLLEHYRNKTKNTVWSILIPSNNEICISHLIAIKHKVMRYMIIRKEMIINKPKLFRKELWRLLNAEFDGEHGYLKFMNDLQQITLRMEIVMESQAAHFGKVFRPDRRKQYGSTLKEAIMNRLALPKNLRLRRKIVKVLRINVMEVLNGMEI